MYETILARASSSSGLCGWTFFFLGIWVEDDGWGLGKIFLVVGVGGGGGAAEILSFLWWPLYTLFTLFPCRHCLRNTVLSRG